MVLEGGRGWAGREEGRQPRARLGHNSSDRARAPTGAGAVTAAALAPHRSPRSAPTPLAPLACSRRTRRGSGGGSDEPRDGTQKTTARSRRREDTTRRGLSRVGPLSRGGGLRGSPPRSLGFRLEAWDGGAAPSPSSEPPLLGSGAARVRRSNCRRRAPQIATPQQPPLWWTTMELSTTNLLGSTFVSSGASSKLSSTHAEISETSSASRASTAESTALACDQ